MTNPGPGPLMSLEDAYESEGLDMRERAIAGWAYETGRARGFMLGGMVAGGLAIALVWCARLL